MPIPMLPGTNDPDINAIIANMLDRQKSYVYDTLKLAPGTTVSSTPYRFFQVPIGQGDPYNNNIVKTELETNMRSAGMFNPPYDMILNNLGFLFCFDNLVFDITTIMRMGWFQFKILQKTMFMGHLWRHPPGAGISGMSTQTSESVWTNGVPEPGAIWAFGKYGKYIPPLVNFTLELQFPETYNTFFNGTASANNIPAAITAKLITPGTISGTALPTTLPVTQGGNGIQLIAFMNGIAGAPVQ
jgi:hypothetical protein